MSAEDFDKADAVERMAAAIAGKVCAGARIDEGDMGDSVLVVPFADGSSLRLRYDWIYEWEVKPPQEGR